jgi:hypothetical protein
MPQLHILSLPLLSLPCLATSFLLVLSSFLSQESGVW